MLILILLVCVLNAGALVYLLSRGRPETAIVPPAVDLEPLHTRLEALIHSIPGQADLSSVLSGLEQLRAEMTAGLFKVKQVLKATNEPVDLSGVTAGIEKVRVENTDGLGKLLRGIQEAQRLKPSVVVPPVDLSDVLGRLDQLLEQMARPVQVVPAEAVEPTPRRVRDLSVPSDRKQRLQAYLAAKRVRMAERQARRHAS